MVMNRSDGIYPFEDFKMTLGKTNGISEMIKRMGIARRMVPIRDPIERPGVAFVQSPRLFEDSPHS